MAVYKLIYVYIYIYLFIQGRLNDSITDRESDLVMQKYVELPSLHPKCFSLAFLLSPSIVVTIHLETFLDLTVQLGKRSIDLSPFLRISVDANKM